MRKHLWFGQWIDDENLSVSLTTLRETVGQSINVGLPVEIVLRACDRMSVAMRDQNSPYYQSLLRCFDSGERRDAQDEFVALAEFLRRSSLELKLVRELGSIDPRDARRNNFRDPNFENWAPLGLLVHFAPGNAVTVGVLSVVEGLLAGNVNALKTSSADTAFPQLFLELLCKQDDSGILSKFIVVVNLRSSETKAIAALLAEASGVAAWGGEEAVASIRKLAPMGARVIEWGHRLSLAYVANEKLRDPTTIESIARDICLIEQQACSSPQCVYIESESPDELARFSSELSKALSVQSRQTPRKVPGPSESAEITMVTAVQRCEQALGLGSVDVAEDQSWRVFTDSRSALRASPLFRSIWVKPLPSHQIFSVLWPMRQYLQTAGVACASERIAEISRKFVASGILRVTETGRMLESYMGEPHDGVYALTRYSRRVSYQLPTMERGITSFSELSEVLLPLPWGEAAKPPIIGKEEFQNRKVSSEYAELYFKSGGSSGEPKISVFTYRDYQTQMLLAAEGLFAAGFDPKTDRAMNLFFGGGLYGGFLSFYTILEHMGAVQFPMAAHLDFQFVLDMIYRYDVNTIMGMPSYLTQLFNDPANAERLRATCPIKKIFFGGEHFNIAQRELFRREYRVEVIRSATYGSVDSGPLGYQCEMSHGSIHHLHHRLQILEILKLDSDFPARDEGEVGRLVFTSLMRDGQSLHRYDIGDLGRWVAGPCACGRKSPRFELMGRHGDVFRAGGSFFNYAKFLQVLTEVLGFSGELQVIIDSVDVGAAGKLDRVRLLLTNLGGASLDSVHDVLLRNYPDLEELVVKERSVAMEIVVVPLGELRRTPGSGKLKRVLDERCS